MTSRFAAVIGATLALGLATPAAAQSPDARAAAGSITEASVRRRIELIAHDSMLGRSTPSPALEQTASWVAEEFRRFGLEVTVQRYPLVRRRLVPERSTVTIGGGARSAELSLSTDAAWFRGDVPATPVGGPLIVIGGAIDPAAIAPDSVRDQTVLWLADFSTPEAAGRADGIGAALLRGRPKLILLAPSDTSLLIAARAAQTAERIALPVTTGQSFLLLAVSEAAVARARPDLAPLLPALRAAPATAFHRPAGVAITARLVDSTVATTSAPNVIGLLRGHGPLANEHVAFSAHMDHLEPASGAPDSVFNGADDNGSGAVGVIELAGAFAKGPRPGRSLLFVVVSGEERGLWGSGYFTGHPPVPIDRIVADVNMDMIGRGWRDTVGVIGREHSDMGAILDQVAARHRDLDMVPIGDVWPTQGRFYRSDHYNFARAGVPILFLSSGYSPDYHEPSDTPDKIDAEKEARLLRLIYWFGLELANRADRPKWRPESYREIVTPR